MTYPKNSHPIVEKLPSQKQSNFQKSDPEKIALAYVAGKRQSNPHPHLGARSCQYQCVYKSLSKYSKRFKSYGTFFAFCPRTKSSQSVRGQNLHKLSGDKIKCLIIGQPSASVDFLRVVQYHYCNCLYSFPVWCQGQDMEFDCIGSWSLPKLWQLFNGLIVFQTFIFRRFHQTEWNKIQKWDPLRAMKTFIRRKVGHTT